MGRAVLMVRALLVAVLAITAAVASSTESSTAVLPEEATYQWNGAAWACADVSATKDDNSCGSIVPTEVADSSEGGLVGESSNQGSFHWSKAWTKQLIKSVVKQELKSNPGQSTNVKQLQAQNEKQQTLIKQLQARNTVLERAVQNKRVPTKAKVKKKQGTKTATRKGEKEELCHGATQLCRTKKQGCSGTCPSGNKAAIQAKLAKFECVTAHHASEVCTSSTKCKGGDLTATGGDPDFPNRPCKCYDGTQSWKPYIAAAMRVWVRLIVESTVKFFEFVYAAACTPDPCEALHCKRYAKGCEKGCDKEKTLRNMRRTSREFTSTLCVKPTFKARITARAAHSRDLGAATRSRKGKWSLKGKLKKAGGKLLKKVGGKIANALLPKAKKLALKLINKLPTKVSFLKPVLRDFVSAMMKPPLKDIKKRVAKLLPRLGKELLKAMKSPMIRSFMFKFLDKTLGAALWSHAGRVSELSTLKTRSRGLGEATMGRRKGKSSVKTKHGGKTTKPAKKTWWQAGQWSTFCFQTFRSIARLDYAVKVSFKKEQPGWPNVTKRDGKGAAVRTLIKAGVCRSGTSCGSDEDIKKGRVVFYIHRVLKSNPRIFCEVKFAPWAKVCNTCCCKKGMVSSGLETSLAYVRPKGSKAKLSCQGWYMNVVSFMNAATATAQRALLAMKLKAARCFD